MNAKQYNNVIDYTVTHEQAAQGGDSLATARAVFGNMGVALPQGDVKAVYDTLKTDDYMGWKSCAMQEAQEAANNGTAAIGISEERIVVLAAADEEEPVTETAAVMALSETTSAYAVSGLEYYSYSAQTTIYRVFNSSYVINQGDANILYPTEAEQPGSENRAFLDTLFYGSVCGKTAASGTIRQYGCAICSLAMCLLFKGNNTNSNDNVYYAVKEATIQGTDSAADFLSGNFEIAYYSDFDNTVLIHVATTNNPDYELNRGNLCIFRIGSNGNSHYVVVYGIDPNKSGTDKYLVADSDGGKLRTLSEAIQRRGLSANMSNITSMRVIS